MDSTASAPSRAVAGQPGAFLAEQQHATFRKVVGLQWHRTGQVVDSQDVQFTLVSPLQQVIHGRVVMNVLVPVGDHRSSPVPAATPNDVDGRRQERIRCANHRADVEVVLPVLDRDVERMPARVKVGDDRVVPPVPVVVGDVASVTLAQQIAGRSEGRRAGHRSTGLRPAQPRRPRQPSMPGRRGAAATRRPGRI